MQDKIIALPARQPAEPGTVSKHTLPAQLTPLIGREHEVTAICTLLHRPHVRLVTLTGAGGIGKTRLGLQVAAKLSDAFPDGVYFVNLAPIRDPSLTISTIAHELGIQVAGTQPLLEAVKSSLRDEQLLLLLDNFEQIVTAAPLLEDLLAACHQLAILVTSREVLHLQAEHLFPVPPLVLPDLTQLPEDEELVQFPAVALFLQRAQAILPDLQLTQDNAQVIAEICVRLDGLPLALELAAARIRLLPPKALLARLAQRLQVLTGRWRHPPGQTCLRTPVCKLLVAMPTKWMVRLSVTKLSFRQRSADFDRWGTCGALVSCFLITSALYPSSRSRLCSPSVRMTPFATRYKLVEALRVFGVPTLTWMRRIVTWYKVQMDMSMPSRRMGREGRGLFLLLPQQKNACFLPMPEGGASAGGVR